MKNFFFKLLMISFPALFSGCASTTITMHELGKTNMCTGKNSALILWGTAWRKDQKEPEIREEIATKAINTFFSESNCFSEFKILKDIDKTSSIKLSDTEAINFSKTSEIKYDKIIFIRLEELGPIVHLNLSFVLVDGSTNVKLRTRVLDTETASLEYDSALDWSNGGPYILKGISSLQQDMYDALKTIFYKSI